MNRKAFFETNVPLPEDRKEIIVNGTKRLSGQLGIVLGSVLLGCTSYGQPVSVGVSVPVPVPSMEIRVDSDFYEPLAPEGEWLVVGSYGRCWRPSHVARDWRPYCNGYWQRTDAGWYWASDEPWAWATYHYGRWDFTDQYGWYWVPQTQWAPAWVSWQSGGGYVGWAPLLPSVRMSAGGFVGFNASLIPPRAFVFVEQRRFLEPIRPATVVVNNTTIISKTTTITNTRIVNNAVINEGPATTIIEKASGRKVEAVPARELRHKQEAPVVARQRTSTPAATGVQPVRTPAGSEAQAREKKAVVAAVPPQILKAAAVPHEPAVPAPKIHELPAEKSKPASAAPELKPVARPEGNRPAVVKQPTPAQEDPRGEKQEKPAKPSDRKAPPPAKEKGVSNEKHEKHGANPADKDRENKPKE